MIAATGWAIHLGTVLETRFQMVLGRHRDDDPWPLPRALEALARLGARREGPPRTLGSGRGMPLLSSQALRWRECPLHLEVQRHRDGGPPEAALELPCWGDLVERVADEDAVWDLVDAFAAAVDATAGVIADGEAVLPGDADGPGGLRRHLGVLTRDAAAITARDGGLYRVLAESGLEVAVR